MTGSELVESGGLESRPAFEHEIMFIDSVSKYIGIDFLFSGIAYNCGVDMIHYSQDFTANFINSLYVPDNVKSVMTSMHKSLLTPAWMLVYQEYSKNVVMIDQLFGAQLKHKISGFVKLIRSRIGGFSELSIFKAKHLQRICFAYDKCFFMFNQNVLHSDLVNGRVDRIVEEFCVVNNHSFAKENKQLCEGWFDLPGEDANLSCGPFEDMSD